MKTSSPLVFMHIGKTAGTTLHFVLHDLLPGRLYAATPEDFDQLGANELDEYDLVMGHLSRNHFDRLPKTAFLFTVLRNPIERVLSSYYFLHTWNQPPVKENETMVRRAKELSLSDFLACDDLQVKWVVENNQSYQLANDWRADRDLNDQELYAKAVETLHGFDCVGTTERLGETVDLLKRRLGISRPTDVGSQNTTPHDPARSLIGPKEWAEIFARNKVDFALYAYACSRLEKDLKTYCR